MKSFSGRVSVDRKYDGIYERRSESHWIGSSQTLTSIWFHRMAENSHREDAWFEVFYWVISAIIFGMCLSPVWYYILCRVASVEETAKISTIIKHTDVVADGECTSLLAYICPLKNLDCAGIWRSKNLLIYSSSLAVAIGNPRSWFGWISTIC